MKKLKYASLDPTTFSSPQEETAIALVEAGISIIPIKGDGTKAPAVPWKNYQSRLPNKKEIHRWFSNGSRYGLAAIGGSVSMGLEIIDFDDPDLFEPWQSLVQEANPDLLDNLPLVITPSIGFHIFFRSPQPGGNQKLAQRKGENGRPEVMIETRAEGGYVLLPGCPPECHAEGEYILISGSLSNIPTISKQQRSLLLDTARSFNDLTGGDGEPSRQSNPSAMTWGEILGPAGWSLGPPRIDKAQNWSRPGRSGVVSATTNFNGSDEFHPFSTNSGPFKDRQFYTKSEAYELLNPNKTNTPSESWPDVTELPDLLPKAPILNLDLLPRSIASWVKDVSERMQVPPSMIAVPILIALSSVVGRSRAIYPKEFDDWKVIPNLWGAVVALSGLLKSPAQQMGLSLLDLLVREAEKKQKQDLIERKAQESIYRLKIKAVEKEITAAVEEEGSCSELRTKLASLLKSQAENHPTERRYRTSDPTVEKLAELMKENSNGMLLCRDEISGWLMNLEKPGREGDREFYLESWSGDSPFDVDRIARGTIKVEALCLSIVGGIQPGKLSRYVSGAVEGGWEADGLLQRLQLLVWPEISDGWELVDRRPNRKACKAAVEVFQRLDRLKEVKTVRLLGGVPGIHFAPDAQEFFNDWLTCLEHRLRSGEIACEALLSHLSKYRSLMPSLSLLIHLSDSPGNAPVSLEAAVKAAGLCDFFEDHAIKIYAPALHPELQAAHALLKKIKAGEVKDGSTVRELYRNGWATLTTPASVRSGLVVLEEYGWLRWERVGTDGRSTEIVRLNPALKNENA